MSDDALDFYLPNAKNCIQSAIYQIGKGNPAIAAEFLESAKRSIDKAAQPNPKRSVNKTHER